MKWAAPVVVLALSVAALWYWRSHSGPIADAPAAAGGSAIVPPAPAITTGSAAPRPPAKVTQVSREQREQLAQRIAAAQAAHGAHSAPARPSLPAGSADHAPDLDRIATNVREALPQAIPFLADCYKQHKPANPKLTTSAQMTLTGDPDIGTVIDADQIFDEHHQPLAKELDDCLRATMQTLELPPLEEGDTVRVEYSFRFDDDDK